MYKAISTQRADKIRAGDSVEWFGSWLKVVSVSTEPRYYYEENEFTNDDTITVITTDSGRLEISHHTTLTVESMEE